MTGRYLVNSDSPDRAVRRCVFDLTVAALKDRNAGADAREFLDLIDAEADAARAPRP